MGRRVWVDVPETVHGTYKIQPHTYDIRVLSFKAFLPANGEKGREKHLVQLWTDPGGMRTLSVGSIKMKDPNRRDGALRRAERERLEQA